MDFEKSHQVAAIVGPNGSGKSNIADAIRWVLGETSYKSLRSKKSEDVIFSGSEAKNRASMAKVSIVLDNADKKAPLDFTEIGISRSVLRDGSSEYLLAGKKSRLLDVAELLAKSGFGQSTYTVIGQGMVDSMLFYGPAERKVLFDEAAGVRAYELKREQTLKKLEDTADNLIRIRDILSELNPRLSTLKRQAEKAKEKDNVKAGLLEKQKVYYSTIWDRLNLSEKDYRADLEKAMSEQQAVEQEITELNEKFNQILNEEQSENKDTGSLNHKIEVLEEQKDGFRQKIFTLRAHLELAGNELSESEIKTKIKELKEELAAIGLEPILKEKSALEAKVAEFSIETLNQKITEFEEQKDALRQKIFELKSQLEPSAAGLSAKELAEKIAQLQAEHENLDEKELAGRLRGTEKEIARATEQLVEVENEIKSAKEKIAELSAKVSKLDFGQVGEKISAILYLQNDFVIKIESAKDMKEVTAAVETGKQISERLKELRKEVGDSKENRVDKITEIQKQLEDLLTEKDNLSKELSRKKADIFKLDYELKGVSDRRFEIEKELGVLSAQKPADESDQKKIAAEINQLKAEIEAANDKITATREQLNAGAAEKAKIINLDYKISHLAERQEKINAEIKKFSEISPSDNAAKKAAEEEIAAHQVEIAKIQKQIEVLRSKLQEHSNALAGQGKVLSDIKDSISGKQSLISEYNQTVTNLRVNLGRIETKKQDIREEISREVGSEAVLANGQVLPELDEEHTRLEIEKLKGKLYAIGEIDPEVETEFSEVSERVQFMDSQTDDLEKAKEDLEHLVKDLDVKIKKQFAVSFEAISKKFSHFFETLFEGGTAKLELVETQNEEDGSNEFGIEITALPPGKRIKSLSALSGGERTMTSLALLFAILSVNPSPFCVLDEVDAALDEANTKRFLKIITELSANTQFIFITHNRDTMKSASIIYGVTMDDSHASRLLSIKLDDALETVKK